MKRTHIIALVIIAVAMAALVSSLGDSSTYADLDEAFAKPGREFHVVGILDKSQPIVYEPVTNASLTQFTMTDLKGRSLQSASRQGETTGSRAQRAPRADRRSERAGRVRGARHADEVPQQVHGGEQDGGHLIP
jgi:hypothetical protein